jgi:hypothetical protein
MDDKWTPAELAMLAEHEKHWFENMNQVLPDRLKWTTDTHVDKDTVEECAAFLKAEGLASPTDITAEDVGAIYRAWRY